MTEETRAKKRFGEGRHGQVAYHISPRYSTWNPTTTGPEGLERFLESERHGHVKALEGELGEDMSFIAKEKGLSGLVTEVQQTAAGWIYTDMNSRESRLLLTPDEDLCGLWELRRNVSNDNSDGRVKNDWRMQGLWKEGARFLLSRNVWSFDARINNLGEERGVADLKEKDLTPEEAAGLWKESGYLITMVGDAYTESRLNKMSDYFVQSLKPVPVNTAQAAIEVSGAGDHHIRKVLEYLVNSGKAGIAPWHLATLLEQSDYREGPFARKSKDDA